jgi:hypothetical protein
LLKLSQGEWIPLGSASMEASWLSPGVGAPLTSKLSVTALVCVLRMEGRALCMLCEHSATELQSSPKAVSVYSKSSKKRSLVSRAWWDEKSTQPC